MKPNTWVNNDNVHQNGMYYKGVSESVVFLTVKWGSGACWFHVIPAQFRNYSAAGEAGAPGRKSTGRISG